jgi:methyl-accepting chemotaxis protein
MKKHFSNKLFGLLLIIFSILGLLFAISGIAATWILRSSIYDAISVPLLSLEDALSSSQEGFTLMDQALDNLLSNLEIIEESFEDLDTTLDGVSESLDTSANLIGDDLKLTVNNTQSALTAASTSAELIDNTLNFLSRIPLLGVDYDPDVPLHISLQQVAANLSEFPIAFTTIEEGINDTTEGLASLQDNLGLLSDQIQEFNTDLEDAQTVLLNFNDSIEIMNLRLGSLNNNLSKYLTILTLFFSGLLFWIGLSQITVLRQGIIYLRGETLLISPSNTQRE